MPYSVRNIRFKSWGISPTLYKNANGFTLVEVIVTAVIVAVLALVAVQLYRGYIDEARQNMTENVAASAARFLSAAVNMNIPIPSATITTPLTGNLQWRYQMPSGDEVAYICPQGMSITIDTDTKKVQVRFSTLTSKWYPYALP